jgi:hypothetical protein
VTSEGFERWNVSRALASGVARSVFLVADDEGTGTGHQRMPADSSARIEINADDRYTHIRLDQAWHRIECSPDL